MKLQLKDKVVVVNVHRQGLACISLQSGGLVKGIITV
jgi:hypothetical protein